RGRAAAAAAVADAHAGAARARRPAHGARPVSRGPVTELAEAIVAPAIGDARGREPAGVAEAGAHRGEAHARRGRHEYGGRPVSRGPVTELPEAVVAPAIGDARGREPAGVEAACAHSGEGWRGV